MPDPNVVAAEATGFPALLMLVAIVGVVVAVGVAIGGRRSRALRVAGISALLFAVGLLIANVDGDDDDSEPAPESLTPRITSTQDADLESLLLTATDVRTIATLSGASSRELGDVGLFENPDPRGPCGTPGGHMPSDGAAGRAFEREGLTLVQLVMEGPAATEYLAEQLADIREPCGPYESTTNTGATQRVEDIDVRRLDGDAGYLMTAVASTEDGQAALTAIAVQVGDRVSVIVGIGAESLREPDLQAMVAIVRLRLAA